MPEDTVAPKPFARIIDHPVMGQLLATLEWNEEEQWEFRCTVQVKNYSRSSAALVMKEDSLSDDEAQEKFESSPDDFWVTMAQGVWNQTCELFEGDPEDDEDYDPSSIFFTEQSKQR